MTFFLLVVLIGDLGGLLIGDESKFMFFSHVLHPGVIFDIILGRRVHSALMECFQFFLDVLELVLTVLFFLFIPPHQ